MAWGEKFLEEVYSKEVWEAPGGWLRVRIEMEEFLHVLACQLAESVLRLATGQSRGKSLHLETLELSLVMVWSFRWLADPIFADLILPEPVSRVLWLY